MADTDWYDRFIQRRNPLFSEDDFENYKKAVLMDLEYYEKYLPRGSRILELGCGLGFKAVPLSSVGYTVVGVDNDKRVVEAARKNAEKFGGDIEILEANILQIDQLFQKDSFDACLCAGVLEHFEENDAKKIMDSLLELAPLAIAIIPLNHDSKHGGMHAKQLSEEDWMDSVFGKYNIAEHFVKSRTGGQITHRLLYVFIKREGTR